jgi:hypothetical protein
MEKFSDGESFEDHPDTCGDDCSKIDTNAVFFGMKPTVDAVSR